MFLPSNTPSSSNSIHASGSNVSGSMHNSNNGNGILHSPHNSRHRNYIRDSSYHLIKFEFAIRIIMIEIIVNYDEGVSNFINWFNYHTCQHFLQSDFAL